MIVGLGAGLLLRSPGANAAPRASGSDGTDVARSGLDALVEPDVETGSAGTSAVADDDELPINVNRSSDGGESLSDLDSQAPIALALTSEDGDDQADSTDGQTSAVNLNSVTNASNSTGQTVATASPVSNTATPVSSSSQSQAGSATTASTTAPASSSSPTPGNTAAPATQTGEWCQVEVGEPNSTLRWNDGGSTSVFRLNGAWFNTPADNAEELVITSAVSTNDNFVMRLWGGGGSTDVACTFGNGTPTPAAPPLPAPITVPSGHVQMGFSADLWGDDREQYWADLEAVPGVGRLIAHEFKSFTRPIRTDVYRWHLESGRDLLLTWNGTDATDILNGSHDEWIREHARELSSLPGNVMLRFWHEPDVSFKREWIDDDPQQFIDSWNYVRAIFAEEQALNIEWVWCPTAWNWEEQGARYYPGDDAVDWICADGYSGWDLDAPLGDIADAYTDFQAWADQRPHKPILVAEFGAGQRGPGDRAEWVEGITDWVAVSSNIRAVVYFDIDMRPHGEIYDWRLRTEPDAWDAMMDVMTSAPFGQ